MRNFYLFFIIYGFFYIFIPKTSHKERGKREEERGKREEGRGKREKGEVLGVIVNF
jgi:hypothetical protein